MKIDVFLFSPTGGTKAVCESLVSSTDGEHLFHDLSDPNWQGIRMKGDEFCIIAMPVYGGRVPPLALERLSLCKGNGAKAILLAVYGNRAYEDALLEMKDAAMEDGFFPTTAIAAIAEHSIIRKIAHGRPDQNDKQTLSHIGLALATLPQTEVQVPGNRPYKKAHGGPKPQTIADKCTNCGMCIRTCPAKAIIMGKKAETVKDRCISCMRCVSLCPSHARSLDKVTMNATMAMLTLLCKERKEIEMFPPVMTVRYGTVDDARELARVEGLCFPQSEAAGEEELRSRLEWYPTHFWLLFDGSTLVSFVDGMVTDQKDLNDRMYEDASLHDEQGAWQMIFGVDTIPSCRRKGYASQLVKRAIEDAKAQGRKGLVLTCKENLIPYYAGFGFRDEGISSSIHGNVVWHQMRLSFPS